MACRFIEHPEITTGLENSKALFSQLHKCEKQLLIDSLLGPQLLPPLQIPMPSWHSTAQYQVKNQDPILHRHQPVRPASNNQIYS